MMAGAISGVVLNSILLLQTLQTAHVGAQQQHGVLKPQPT